MTGEKRRDDEINIEKKVERRQKRNGDKKESRAPKNCPKKLGGGEKDKSGTVSRRRRRLPPSFLSLFRGESVRACVVLSGRLAFELFIRKRRRGKEEGGVHVRRV